jgi:hypothetical protein
MRKDQMPRPGAGMPPSPACPFCEKRDTELANPFGSHASVSTYWCRSCKSPFEVLKWRPQANKKAELD